MSTFTQSEQIGELIAALAKAQLEFGSAIKDSDNPFFKSKYADLAANINAVRPALNKHGIAVIQADSSELEHAIARVRTSLHCGEQWIASEAEAPAIDKSGNINVQTLGSAWTYLRRYTLQALCGLASEDDDGNSLSNGMTDGKKPAQTAAEKKWDEIDPELPRIGDTKGQLKAAVVKIDAEKRAASEGNKLAQEQGTFILENGVLTAKVIGIEKKQTRETPPRDFLRVTFNSRFVENQANYASCYDTELWDSVQGCLDNECQLKIEFSRDGKHAKVADVIATKPPFRTVEPLFEGA